MEPRPAPAPRARPNRRGAASRDGIARPCGSPTGSVHPAGPVSRAHPMPGPAPARVVAIWRSLRPVCPHLEDPLPPQRPLAPVPDSASLPASIIRSRTVTIWAGSARAGGRDGFGRDRVGRDRVGRDRRQPTAPAPPASGRSRCRGRSRTASSAVRPRRALRRACPRRNLAEISVRSSSPAAKETVSPRSLIVTRCSRAGRSRISIHSLTSSQMATCWNSSTAKSAPRSRLTTRRTLRLNSAVTPAASS